LALVVAAVDEYCPATGVTARFRITPAIPDHEACRKVDTQFGRGIQQHSRLGLSAFAFIVVVPADAYSVETQFTSNVPIHRIDSVPAPDAAPDIRLIGHHHQGISGLFQRAASGADFGQDY
jgi:hypothetical protein